ncbi:MAG: pyridoxamine kinase [Clostridia bacterium]|nr:pyridoxamine kinase [Clostridia bacterium]
MHKRILAVHDISCIGRCSLTVALPILSAAGIETSVLPTAVLSTHTGNFEGYTFRDLTQDIAPICNHWESLGITFDSIFTGYLGSFEQMELVKTVFDKFSRKDTLVMVDPVMGDNGRLYSNLTKDFASGFRDLSKNAHVITPNLTEAAMLLDIPYCGEGYTEDYIKNLLKSLADLGPEKIVLTGVSFYESQLGCAVYDKTSNETNFVYEEKVEGLYHGTGDVFSSALLAALMNGLSLPASTAAAVGFTAGAIRRTRRSGAETRYGVNFEAGLAEFGLKLKSKK